MFHHFRCMISLNLFLGEEWALILADLSKNVSFRLVILQIFNVQIKIKFYLIFMYTPYY